MSIERRMRGRVHYGWIVVAVTFVTLLAAAGIRSAPGVLIIPLEREFGWTRATVSFAVSINLFLYGLSGPFIAGLMDRLGIRRVMVTSLALVATGVALTTLMTASWQLALLWGVVVGLGTGTMASVLGAMVANRWFTERRGVVLGLLTASSATGQLLFLPLLASMVVRLGWRSAVLLVAGVALVVLPLVALLMRDHPRDIGLRPFGEPGNAPLTPSPRAAAAAPLIGLVLGLRSRDFWLLAGSFFICGLSTNGLIGTHLIPASMEHGIPEVMAASLLASIGLLDIIGTTVSGWLSDRWDNRYLLCWYYGLRGLSLLFLPYAFGSAYLGLSAFVIFYGLDWVATVPPTARLAADTFGRENVGIMFGWIFASHQLGAATAAYGGGLLHTWLGDYQVTFMSAGLVCLIAAGLVLRIGQASRPLPTRVVEAAGA
jgi:sugar phosphate permease